MASTIKYEGKVRRFACSRFGRCAVACIWTLSSTSKQENVSEGKRERERERVREGEEERNRERYWRQRAGVNSERDEDNPAMLAVVLRSSATKKFGYILWRLNPLCFACSACHAPSLHSIARACQET